MSTRQPTTIDTTGINVNGLEPDTFDNQQLALEAIRDYASRRDMLACDTATEHAAAAAVGTDKDVYITQLIPILETHADFSSAPPEEAETDVRLGIVDAINEYREVGSVDYRPTDIPADADDEFAYRYGWRCVSGLPDAHFRDDDTMSEKIQTIAGWVVSRAGDRGAPSAGMIRGSIYMLDRFVGRFEFDEVLADDTATFYHLMAIAARDMTPAKYTPILADELAYADEWPEIANAFFLDELTGPLVEAPAIFWSMGAGAFNPDEVPGTLMDPVTCIGHADDDGRINLVLHAGSYDVGDRLPGYEGGFKNIDMPQFLQMI